MKIELTKDEIQTLINNMELAESECAITDYDLLERLKKLGDEWKDDDDLERPE